MNAIPPSAGTAIKGYAAYEKETDLRPFEYKLPKIGPRQVLVRVTHCGVCYSDIDCIDDAFGWSVYPFIPGHEIVGAVVALGDAVSHLQVGQRVGIGPNRSSCMNCRECNNGFEQLCDEAVATLQPGEHGGFADHICVSSEWAIPVPDELDSTSAAPLMCAGVTAFTPLRLYTTPLMKIGVVGIGGLGHLAVQFAAKMGHEVTAFAARPGEDSIRAYRALGADHVIDFTDREAMGPTRDTLDFIFSTIYGGDVGLKPFVRALRARGRLCVVGAAMEPMDFPAARLVFGQKSICGSASGGREHSREMLEFAARHDIRPMTETMKMSEVNDAIAKVKARQVRFRMVLENDLGGA